MQPLGPGRIFWAVYPGNRGDQKTRPMIVATRRTELVRTGQFLAVVCSTDFDEANPCDSEIELPSHPEGRCATRLRKRTVAICDWTTILDVKDVKETAGLVPSHILRDTCCQAGISFPAER
jgi:hypothetical protein